VVNDVNIILFTFTEVPMQQLFWPAKEGSCEAPGGPGFPEHVHVPQPEVSPFIASHSDHVIMFIIFWPFIIKHNIATTRFHKGQGHQSTQTFQIQSSDQSPYQEKLFIHQAGIRPIVIYHQKRNSFLQVPVAAGTSVSVQPPQTQVADCDCKDAEGDAMHLCSTESHGHHPKVSTVKMMMATRALTILKSETV